MRHVERIKLVVQDTNLLTLPVGAQLLDVQLEEDEEPYLLVLVPDHQQQMETRTIRMFSDHAPIADGVAHYIGAFRYLWNFQHVFEIKPSHE